MTFLDYIVELPDAITAIIVLMAITLAILVLILVALIVLCVLAHKIREWELILHRAICETKKCLEKKDE